MKEEKPIDNSSLLARSEEHVVDLYKTMERTLLYHNLDHTQNVVKAATKIAKSCELSSYDQATLLVAAWFHDTGYKSSTDEHEKESVRIMRAALTPWNVPESRLKEIEEIILSTQLPHKPTNLLCRIICDADMIHLSDTRDYAKISENLRVELNRYCGKNINKEQWRRMNVEFMDKHCYFTEYGRRFLRPRKFAILSRIKEKMRSMAGI